MLGNSVSITGGYVVPIEGQPIPGGTVLVVDGKIAAVGGPDLKPPPGVATVDATGKWVLPGFIDAHTHLGAREEGEGWAGHDTNELTGPVQPHVRVLDAINPADEGFRDAIAGGVLAAGVTPGSGNPIGGQTVAIRCWGLTIDDMVLRSPAGMKSALGENPKRVLGERRVNPSSRLGTAAAIRSALVDAAAYLAKTENPQNHSDERSVVTPARDLKLEALARVLRREIPWRQHCHRADDIATGLRLAAEFGYDLVLDHCTEGYLLASKIAEAGVPVVTGPLITARSKVELRNRTMANPGLLAAAGVTVAIAPGRAPPPPPGGPDPPADRPGGAGDEGGPGSGDRPSRGHDHPGTDHAGGRPHRLARSRKGRGPGHLVGRSVRRDVQGRGGVHRGPRDLPVRLPLQDRRFRNAVRWVLLALARACVRVCVCAWGRWGHWGRWGR
jgi:imidazolonepropionase-like amidohydrolase